MADRSDKVAREDWHNSTAALGFRHVAEFGVHKFMYEPATSETCDRICQRMDCVCSKLVNLGACYRAGSKCIMAMSQLVLEVAVAEMPSDAWNVNVVRIGLSWSL